MANFQVSLSAFQDWQQCEQKYFYKHVRRLRPHVRPLAMDRGSLLHEYLASFYTGIQGGRQAAEAHLLGREKVLEREKEMKIAAAAAVMAGDEEVAAEFMELIPVCLRIADFYFQTHGRTDAERYEVLLVEKAFGWRIMVGVNSASVIDLVWRDRNSGRTSLVEHKTTGNLPPDSYRIRDLQTVLYSEVLARYGIPVGSILWNYIRTKEPATPHKNKTDGKISRAKDIDTTWTIYEQAIIAAGQNPENYADVRARLQGREFSAFFPRFEYPIVASPEALITDYLVEASRMRVARLNWEKGINKPVRTLTRNCDFCEFYRVCEAAVMGGDEEDVIAMRFNEKGRQNAIS